MKSVTGGRKADLGHDAEERGRVLVDQSVRIRPEKAQVPGIGGVRARTEAFPRQTGTEAIISGRRATIPRRRHLDHIAAFRHGVGAAQIAADERLVAAGGRRSERREIRRVEPRATRERVRQLPAADGAHRSDRRGGAGRLLRQQEPGQGDAAKKPHDSADEDQVDERKPLRFTD